MSAHLLGRVALAQRRGADLRPLLSLVLLADADRVEVDRDRVRDAQLVRARVTSADGRPRVVDLPRVTVRNGG